MSKEAKSGEIRGTTQQRLERAVDLLASGLRYSQVRSTLVGHYNITDRGAEKIIKRAYGVLAEEAEEKRPEQRAKILAAQWRLFRRAETAASQSKDYKAASDILDRIAELQGLHEARKIDAQVQHVGVLAVPQMAGSAAEWGERIAKYKRKGK